MQQLPQEAHKRKQAKRQRPAAAKPLDSAAARLAAVTANVEMHERNLQRAIYERQKVKYGLLQMREGMKDGPGPRSSDSKQGNATSVLPVNLLPFAMPCLLFCCRGFLEVLGLGL